MLKVNNIVIWETILIRCYVMPPATLPKLPGCWVFAFLSMCGGLWPTSSLSCSVLTVENMLDSENVTRQGPEWAKDCHAETLVVGFSHKKPQKSLAPWKFLTVIWWHYHVIAKTSKLLSSVLKVGHWRWVKVWELWISFNVGSRMQLLNRLSIRYFLVSWITSL